MIDGTENERDKLILKTLFGTGIRVSGLCNLKYEKLDFSTNSGTVVGKGNKERIISLNAKLLEDIYKF
jgi:site-specific recombinase XerD